MILQGDARSIPLRSGSVHAVITSPPYWGLRQYDAPLQIWGGDPLCGHHFGEELRLHKGGSQGAGLLEERSVASAKTAVKDVQAGAFCSLCGAWRGQLGLEPSISLYIEHLVEIFAEVHRILRPDGTLWLNMGDCFATGAGPVGQHPGGGQQGEAWRGLGPATQPNRMPQEGLKPKDLAMLPHRLALALQAWGWWVRMDVVWAKGMSFCPGYSGSVMPESVKDRPTKAHEYVFLLTKEEAYFYDHEAIREPAVRAEEFKWDPGTNGHEGGRSAKGSGKSTRRFSPRPGSRAMPPQPGEPDAFHEVGRNLRSVWAITTQPFPEAHFATFPEALIEPIVKAATSERGVCPACGAPWQRIVQSGEGDGYAVKAREVGHPAGEQDERRRIGGGQKEWNSYQPPQTLGWEPSCACQAGEPVKPLVLDPFSGSGTVALVCNRLGRRALGLELSAVYCRMAYRRSAQMGLL